MGVRVSRAWRGWYVRGEGARLEGEGRAPLEGITAVRSGHEVAAELEPIGVGPTVWHMYTDNGLA